MGREGTGRRETEMRGEETERGREEREDRKRGEGGEGLSRGEGGREGRHLVITRWAFIRKTRPGVHRVPSTKEQTEDSIGVVSPRRALSLEAQPGIVHCGSEHSV